MGELARVAPPKLTTKQWKHIFGTENDIYIYTKEYLYSIIVFFVILLLCNYYTKICEF